MSAREMTMGGEDGPGLQDQDAEQVEVDHSTSAQRTVHASVEPDTLIRTLVERSASRILWFAAGRSILFGLYTGGSVSSSCQPAPRRRPPPQPLPRLFRLLGVRSVCSCASHASASSPCPAVLELSR